MSNWIPDTRPTAYTSASPIDPGVDRHLRQMDCLLAGLVLLLLCLPLGMALLLGRIQGQATIGVHGRPFQRWSLVFGDHLPGRLFSRLGASQWPVVLNILRGDMAWVGPSLSDDANQPPAPHRVRPGLVNLWTIRRRTAVDFGTEEQATREYLSRRSVRHDLGLLLRAAFVGLITHTSRAQAGKVTICDVTFDNVNMVEALAQVRDMLDGEQTRQVSFVNPACVNIAAQDRGYRRALARCDLVLPDGIGTKIGADLLGTPIKQNVNGTDLFPRLCDILNARRSRIFLLGGQVGVPQTVAQVIQSRWPGIEVVGTRDGFFSVPEEGIVAAQVRASGADLLLVARGVPIQDVFIDRHLPHFGVKVAMGVGGLFDFVSGRIDRAPQWMRDIGLEWVYRLMQEPQRMWKRYLIGNFTFLIRVALQRIGLRAPALDTRTTSNPSSAAVPHAPDSPSLVGLRTVLFATDAAAPDVPVPDDFPCALLPLGAETFAERIMAGLADAGVADVDLVVSNQPEALRQLLGEGQRWGINLRWHLVKDPGRPYDILRALDLAGCKRVLIGHADHWINSHAITQLSNANQVAMRIDKRDHMQWAGWASLTPESLRHMDARRDLFAQMPHIGPKQLVLHSTQCVTAGHAHDLFEAQSLPLTQGTAPPTWIPTPWGAMSPQAHIHEEARIIGPVFIGPGCHVNKQAQIGPNVVLTRNVVVSSGTAINDSLILPDTFFGNDLDVSHSVVSGARLHNFRLGVDTTLAQSDGLIMGMKPAPSLRSSFVARLLALLLAALLSPLVGLDLLIRHLRGQGARWQTTPVVTGRDEQRGQLVMQALRCASQQGSAWGQSVAQFGGLLDIVQGYRCWFGTRPRQDAEWYALSHEWQVLLSTVPVGWLHEPDWSDSEDIAMEARAAADAFYAVRRGWKEHVRIAAMLIKHTCRPHTTPHRPHIERPVWHR